MLHFDDEENGKTHEKVTGLHIHISQIVWAFWGIRLEFQWKLKPSVSLQPFTKIEIWELITSSGSSLINLIFSWKILFLPWEFWGEASMHWDNEYLNISLLSQEIATWYEISGVCYILWILKISEKIVLFEITRLSVILEGKECSRFSLIWMS